MLAVYIDPAINKYSKQIKFALEYLLDTSGFFWKYLEPDTELSDNDVILYYSSELPETSYLDWMIENYTLIYIPHLKDLYIPGCFTGDKLKQSIKTFKYEINLPFICNKRFSKSPIHISEKDEKKFCIFDFDLIGNIFYQLSDDDRNHLADKDKNGKLILNKLGFNEYFDSPFINHYVEIFTLLVKELISYKNQWGIRRCLWPADQPLAALISHNLDRLQKWTIGSIFQSFFEMIFLFITLRFGVLFRNLASIIKFLFTNEEDYWNFYEISLIEKKHKYQSTWFLGVNKDKEHLFDYNHDDPDLLKELNELINYGSEVALLNKSEKKSIEEIRKDFELLITKVKLKKSGIRHLSFFEESEYLDKFHQDLGIKYESSRRLQDRNAFYNGFALPYPMYAYNNVTVNKPVTQLPVTFTDELLKLNKYNYISYDDASNTIKELTKNVKKVKGLIHFQFSNSLFHEIKYMPKLFEYTIDHLKNQNAFLTSCSGLVEWINKRNSMTVKEENNKIIIKFLDNIEQITFEVTGNKIISHVFGGNCSYKKNIVQFVNVVKNLEIEIHLSDWNITDA